MDQLPVPCVHCRTRKKYACKLQDICAKVKRYKKSRQAWEMHDYGWETHRRLEKMYGRRR